MFVSRARDWTVMPAVRLSKGSESPWIQRAIVCSCDSQASGRCRGRCPDRRLVGRFGPRVFTRDAQQCSHRAVAERHDGPSQDRWSAIGAETCQGLRSAHRCTRGRGRSKGYTRHVQTPATSGIVPFCAAMRSKREWSGVTLLDVVGSAPNGHLGIFTVLHHCRARMPHHVAAINAGTAARLSELWQAGDGEAAANHQGNQGRTYLALHRV